MPKGKKGGFEEVDYAQALGFENVSKKAAKKAKEATENSKKFVEVTKSDVAAAVDDSAQDEFVHVEIPADREPNPNPEQFSYAQAAKGSQAAAQEK